METRKIIILLILAFLHHAVPSEKAKEVRLRLRHAPETDSNSKPDLHLEIKLRDVPDCAQNTKEIENDYNPSFPEVFLYKYTPGGKQESLIFAIYENEHFRKDQWKLGQAYLYYAYIREGKAHMTVGVSTPRPNSKDLMNKDGKRTTLHIWVYAEDGSIKDADPKLKEYKGNIPEIGNCK